MPDLIQYFQFNLSGGKWEKRLFQTKDTTHIQSGNERAWGRQGYHHFSPMTQTLTCPIKSVHPLIGSPSHQLWLVPTPPNLTPSGILRYHLLEASLTSPPSTLTQCQNPTYISDTAINSTERSQPTWGPPSSDNALISQLAPSQPNHQRLWLI